MNELEEFYLVVLFRQNKLKQAVEERNKGRTSFKTMEFKNIFTELLKKECPFLANLKEVLKEELREIKSPLIEELTKSPFVYLNNGD